MCIALYKVLFSKLNKKSSFTFIFSSSKLISSLSELIKSTSRLLAFCRHSLNVTFYLQAAISRIDDVQVENTALFRNRVIYIRLTRKLFSICIFISFNFLLWKILNMCTSIWDSVRNVPIHLTQLQQLTIHGQSCFMCSPTQHSSSPNYFGANIKDHII